MAALPDPRDHSGPEAARAMANMAAARSHADGRSELGQVYISMFNNPGVAEKVGALGEQIRFEGCLPDPIREIAILRFAYRKGLRYEWAHHARPATLAGLAGDEIASLATDRAETIDDPLQRAAIEIVDQVVRGESIPAELQERFTAEYGNEGVVELVALCGLYSLMGFTVNSFDIAIEPGLPEPPF